MRYYSSVAPAITLTGSINSAVTSFGISSATGLPVSYPFTLVIDPGEAAEEIITVSNVSGTTLTVTRGEDGSSAQAHSIGAQVRHMITARDLREPQEHMDADENVHGIGSGNAVVGTGTTQTLTGKTISGALNTLTAIPSASVTGLDTHTSATAAHGATGAVVGTTNTQTLTNKTINGPDNTLTNIAQSSVTNLTTDLSTLTTAISTEATNRAAAILAAVPAGVIQMWGGAAAPTGWLLCDGTAVSRSTYSAIFAVIGTTFGVGNGSTTFNLPSFKGRVPVGLDSGQTEFDALGETGGAKTHTLTASEMPSHSHTTRIHASYMVQGVGSSEVFGAHEDGAEGTSVAGGDGAHNNLQPYLTINYIIKA